MTAIYNYQPVCSNPRTACVSNAAGYTMCASCPSDPVRGPVWHPTRDMLKVLSGIKSEKLRFLEALENFKNAAVALTSAWHDDTAYAGNANDSYPFNESFDEVVHGVMNWADEIEEANK